MLALTIRVYGWFSDAGGAGGTPWIANNSFFSPFLPTLARRRCLCFCLCVYLARCATQGDPIDELIRTVLLEEKSGQTSLIKDQYCIRWTLANEVNLVFVVVFQKFLISKSAQMDDLLRRVKNAFVKTFGSMLATIQYVPTSLLKARRTPSHLQLSLLWLRDRYSGNVVFDSTFDKVMQKSTKPSTGRGASAAAVAVESKDSESDEEPATPSSPTVATSPAAPSTATPASSTKVPHSRHVHCTRSAHIMSCLHG